MNLLFEEVVHYGHYSVSLQVLEIFPAILDLPALETLPIQRGMRRSNSEWILRGSSLEDPLLEGTCLKALLFLWSFAISSSGSETKSSPVYRLKGDVYWFLKSTLPLYLYFSLKPLILYSPFWVYWNPKQWSPSEVYGTVLIYSQLKVFLFTTTSLYLDHFWRDKETS